MQTQYQIRKMTPKTRYNRKITLHRPFSVVKHDSTKSTSRTFIHKKQNVQQKINKLKVKNVFNVNHLELSSTSWCLYDAQIGKEIGFRHNYQRQIASLTKIMTTIIAIELSQKFKLRQDLMVKVTNAASQLSGTSANLKQNQWIYVQDLLYGTMLPSGNDAAYLLSEIFGFFLYSIKKRQQNQQYFKTFEKIDFSDQINTNLYFSEFIKEMNIKTNQLKMVNTRFSNPHGLANGMNVSCAKDMITLSRYSSKNKKFKKIMNTQYKWYYTFLDEYKQKKRMEKWLNTNNLLKKGWEGVKTGQTLPAGNCLSSLKDDIFIVVLNCNTMQSRFNQTQKLYNWYIENYRNNFSTFQSSQEL